MKYKSYEGLGSGSLVHKNYAKLWWTKEREALRRRINVSKYGEISEIGFLKESIGREDRVVEE